jgi:hypothetical protein
MKNLVQRASKQHLRKLRTFVIGTIFGFFMDLLIADQMCRKFPYFYTKLAGDIDIMGSIEFSVFAILAVISYKKKAQGWFWFNLGVVFMGLMALFGLLILRIVNTR